MVTPVQVEKESLSSSPIFKAGSQSRDGNPFEYVLSDETRDRAGDIVRASGWDLSTFRKNPIALFGHDHHKVIGTWERVRIEGRRLVGELKLARQGTSKEIDTIRSLVEQRILRAVSVGFIAEDGKPLDKKKPFGGFEYTKSILLETSLVAVPANPSALQIARAFYSHADDLFIQSEHEQRAGVPPGQATIPKETPRLDAARRVLKAMGR